MAKGLTSAAIMRYRPGKGRREIRDGGCQGLYLVIQPSGHRSFALRFRRPDGAPAKLTLGSFDASGTEPKDGPVLGAPLSLAAARVLSAEIHRQRAQGRDVIADHAAAKHRRRAEIEESAENTFAAAVVDFTDQHARPKTRRWRANARLLGLAYSKDGSDGPTVIKGGLAERWSDRPITKIDPHDIWAVVDEARRLGVPGLERRATGRTDPLGRVMLACLSSFFGWLKKNRRIERNPCADIDRPDASPPRDRVLTEAEIVRFWRACDKVGEPIGQVLKLLLLTGCRRTELAGMRRDELGDDGTWTIPSSRTKNKRVHVVPLSPLARSIIASVKPVASPAGYVLTIGGKSPVGGWSKIKERLDAALGPESPWRIHDLRRTTATGMATIGVPPHIVEACLNHASGAKAGVAGTYNRAAYAPEKRAALERWAAHIERVVSGEPAKKVVGLRAVQQ